jgi:hypothetical protein
MWYRRLLLLPLLTLACDNPVAALVLTCEEPPPIYAILQYPMEYGICFDSPSGEALIFTAKSSDTGVVTADVAGDRLLVTGQSKGEARVTVMARGASGASGTVDYQVVARNAWSGEITRCVTAPATDEGTDFEIDYWLMANVDLVNVLLRLTVGGIESDAYPLGDMTRGQRIQRYVSGWMRPAPTSDECRLNLDYEIAN